MSSFRSFVAELVKSLDALLIGIQSLATSATKNLSRQLGMTLVLILVLCLSGCWDNLESVPQPPASSPVVVTQSDGAIQPDPSPVRVKPADVSVRPPSPALIAFLEKFDVLSNRGFVPTLRSGSTGIGYTLETMLEIEENNSPRGDFMGMELKAFRDDDVGLDDAEKMNLFLKEPKWIDGLKGSQRVKEYGYIDDNGRTALYSTVTRKTSSHHFRLFVDRSVADGTKVWLEFRGKRVGFWTSSILEKRLLEKHSETAFVSAHSQGRGKKEQFHYFGVTWCAEPSIERFLEMIEDGSVLLELRMHLKESGAARNHGSAFRIQQNRIRDLYRVARQVRTKLTE